MIHNTGSKFSGPVRVQKDGHIVFVDKYCCLSRETKQAYYNKLSKD